MKLLFMALMALAVLAVNADHSHHQTELEHREMREKTASGFRKGLDYRFHYDSQSSAGFAPWISGQRAAERIQADVLIRFHDEQRASLSLSHIKDGVKNRDGDYENGQRWNTAEIQPMRSFDVKPRDTKERAEFLRLLVLPVNFKYNEGQIYDLLFTKDDEPWSKNIKKAVIAMIQLTLKTNNIESELPKTYAVQETHVEGECETLYVWPSSKHLDSRSKEIGRVNITKTVNFENCERLTDIGYGLQVETNTEEGAQPDIYMSMAEEDERQLPKDQNNKQENRFNRRSGNVVPIKKVERSTVYHYQLNWDKKDRKVESYGIEQVDVLSQYTLRTLRAESMQTMSAVTASRLRLIECTESRQNEEHEKNLWGEAETLIYNTDLEAFEKQYIMYGDSKFSEAQLPDSFKVEQQKEMGENLLKQLEFLQKTFGVSTKRHNSEENREHFEKSKKSLQHHSVVFQQLVEFLRRCTVEQLQKIATSVQDRPEAKNLYAFALAAAASHNTITVLSDHIQKNQIDQTKATQVLSSLGAGSGLPAPSEAQIDLIITLCNSKTVAKAHALRHSCWMTFGSMVRERFEQSRRAEELGNTWSPMKTDEFPMNKNKMDLYKDILIDLLTSSKNMFEKIVSLKAIGNAGLPNTLQELKDLVQDDKQPVLARQHAIEAMRYHAQLPETAFRVQNALLPIFSNVREVKPVRFAAIKLILKSGFLQNKRNVQSMIDQIVHTLKNERSEHMKMFVYGMLETSAKSPLDSEKRIVSHLKSALMGSNINPSKIKSGFLKSQWISGEQNEGFSFNYQNSMPNHLSLGVDTFINGDYQKDFIKLSLCQKNMEHLVRELMEYNGQEADLDWESDQESISAKNAKTETSKGFFSNAADQIQSIFSKLKIKSINNSNQDREPIAIFSVRVNDRDVNVISIGEMITKSGDKLPTRNQLKQMLIESFGNFEPMHINGFVPVSARKSVIPTSAGLSLQVRQNNYVQIHAEVGQKKEQYSNLLAELFVKPKLAYYHIQSLQIHSGPYHSFGVESQRHIEVNLPTELKIQTIPARGQLKRQVKISLGVPQNKVELLSIRTLPITFVEYKNPQGPNSMPSIQIKSIENLQLISNQREINFELGKEILLLPIRIQGHYHTPRDMKSLKEIVRVLMTTQNEFSVTFEPIRGETPREIVFGLSADWFERSGNSHIQNLKSSMKSNFGSLRVDLLKTERQTKSDLLSSEEEFSQQGLKQMLNNVENNLEKRTSIRSYKHALKLSVETVGGRRSLYAKINADAVCDAHIRACEANFQLSRSPIYHDEENEWNMKCTVRSLYPKRINDVTEFDTTDEQPKFFSKIDMEWGEKRRSITKHLKINIEGSPSTHMNRLIEFQQTTNDLNKLPRNNYEWITTSQRKNLQRGNIQQPQINLIPFVNKFNVLIDYKLESPMAEKLNELWDYVKQPFYWNTKQRLLSPETQTKPKNYRDNGSLQSGLIQSSLVIEPLNSYKANLTVQTPTQQYKIKGVQIPFEMKPITLTRSENELVNIASVRGFHEGKHLMQSLLDRGNGQAAECRVGGRHVETYDGAEYNAPTSTCYTVLSKDCSGHKKPKFVVLLKSVAEHGEDKKIKIITQNDVIEAQPEGPMGLKIKINGMNVYSSENLQDELIPYNVIVQKDQERRDVMTLDNGPLYIRFNGQHVKILLSEEFMNKQCGLCGNYNDQIEDELSTYDEDMLENVKNFHKSYSIQDDTECSSAQQKRFYESERFGNVEENEQKGSIYEADMLTKKNQVETIKKTLTREYNDKICFSKQTVKQCPRGSYAVKSEEEGELLGKQKVSFTCLERDSIEAKRNMRAVRRNNTVTVMPEYPVSFIEPISIPERCFVY